MRGEMRNLIEGNLNGEMSVGGKRIRGSKYSTVPGSKEGGRERVGLRVAGSIVHVMFPPI